MIKCNRIYKAKSVIVFDNIPFKRVVVTGLCENLVMFETEWPIRQFTLPVEEFEKKFEKE